MAGASIQKLCSQLEAEHERVVKELQVEIVQLRQSLTVSTDVSTQRLPDKSHSWVDPVAASDKDNNKDMSDTVAAPEGEQVTPKIQGAVSSNSLRNEEQHEHDEERYALSILWPKWLECCGVSRDGIVDWMIWWEDYKEPARSGRVAALIFSGMFQSFIMCTILCNTVFIITQTDTDMENSLNKTKVCGGGVNVSDVVFTSIYIVELALKLSVHRQFFFTHGDWRWNIFDAFLVFTACLNFITDNVLASGGCGKESSLNFLRTFRVLKSARVLRMLRVVRFVQELRLMLDCVVHSMLHLVWCVVLVGMMLLMFALFIMQDLKSHVAEADDNSMVFDRFDTVANTMVSLLMATTGGVDWSTQYDYVSSTGISLRIAYLFYISFFTMVAWNIVMSSFVEKASRLGVSDLEASAMEKYHLQQTHVRELSMIISKKLDENHDGTLSLTEFRQHMHDQEIIQFFLERDINMTDVDMFFGMLLAGGNDCFDIKTFARSIVRLRGNASAIDMQSLHFALKGMQAQQEKRFSKLEEELQGLGTVDSRAQLRFEL